MNLLTYVFSVDFRCYQLLVDWIIRYLWGNLNILFHNPLTGEMQKDNVILKQNGSDKKKKIKKSPTFFESRIKILWIYFLHASLKWFKAKKSVHYFFKSNEEIYIFYFIGFNHWSSHAFFENEYSFICTVTYQKSSKWFRILLGD